MSTTEAARAEVDNGAWDAGRALASCSTAADFRSVCAGERAEGEPDQRQHWALPHHSSPGAPPNVNGVRAALAALGGARSGKPNITNTEAARRHLEAHMRVINPDRALPGDSPSMVVRALPALELDTPAKADGTLGVVRGDLAVYGPWAEIKSVFEGHFMERVAPGSLTEAIQRDVRSGRTKFLLEHGQHPVAGRLPLGPLERIVDGPERAKYEAPLLDTALNRDLLPGIRAGLYGSSWRGEVEVEWEYFAGKSAHNPNGIDERTVTNVSPLFDVSVTPFPAYLEAGAAARSLTDEFVQRALESGEGLDRFQQFLESRKNGPVIVTTRSEDPPPDESEPAGVHDAQQTPDETAAAEAPTPNESSTEVVETRESSVTITNEPAATPTEPAAEESAHGDAMRTPPPGTSRGGNVSDTATDAGVDLSGITSPEKLAERKQYLASRAQEINTSATGRSFNPDERREWEAIKAEQRALDELDNEWASRSADLSVIIGDNPGAGEAGASQRSDPVKPTRTTVHPFEAPRKTGPTNPYDLEAYRSVADDPVSLGRAIVSGAMRAIESEGKAGTLPPPGKLLDGKWAMSTEDMQAAIERTMTEARTSGGRSGKGYVAELILATGSEAYRSAFTKFVGGTPGAMPFLTTEESRAVERALSLTGASGGFAVPFQLDPTLINTTNGAVNPIRRISRVVPMVVDTWQGVTSGGITAAYVAEATEAGDNAPTLAQPSVSTERAEAFVPFSIEAGMDWDTLQRDITAELTESKDELEAVKFISGTGTNEPFGVITGATNTVNATTGQTFTLANLYALQEALPPRYEPRASFVAANPIYNRIRQFDTAGGAGLWVTLGQGTRTDADGRLPEGLLAYPTYQASAMATTPATGNKFLLFGDFSRYVIAERVGLMVDLIPHLFGTNHRPTGQRGLFAMWRNGAKVIDANAFRVLIGIV